MSFKCSGCGACCRALTDDIGLPHFDGHCVFLDGNDCTIYENRPLVCKVDEYWRKAAKLYVSRRRWYGINAAYCNELQEQEGLPVKYRLKVIQ